MQRFSQFLLDVWREACRHIEIEEFLANVAALLSKHMPTERVVIRRLNPEQNEIVTVAAAPIGSKDHISEDRRVYEASELKQVVRWSQSHRMLARGKRLSGVLGLILPDATEDDLLAAPLTHGGSTFGAILCVAKAGRTFDADHRELLDRLREPFSMALENDRRVHEIASLREAAEADRGSLLRRLGRTELVEEIIGEETGLRLVMERVGLVAGSDVPVLILGETGTGKEVVARTIHNRSDRQDGPFIRVNCGAIPHELIDSQLFGHERGSFTGADQTRHGWFERADKGTLLLDEIGELPLEAQVRFLRVLQDGFVERVGGTHPVHVNVRIVAATHRDLAQMVREGRFREDLWYRLAVFPILMPPLRDRIEDIPDLARHFAERAATRFGLTATYPTAEDLELLQIYTWPGNIREFGAVIDRAAILGNGHRLEVSKSLGFTEARDAQDSPKTQSQSNPAVFRASRTGEPDQLLTLEQVIKTHIERALIETNGQVEGKLGAAAVLDINPHTLRARMRKLGIEWTRFRSK
ncbi:MAG: sigma 54-interacting transcriptional regulator [Planctomycetaceae bacterium]